MTSGAGAVAAATAAANAARIANGGQVQEAPEWVMFMVLGILVMVVCVIAWWLFDFLGHGAV